VPDSISEEETMRYAQQLIRTQRCSGAMSLKDGVITPTVDAVIRGRHNVFHALRNVKRSSHAPVSFILRRMEPGAFEVVGVDQYKAWLNVE
jgi:hypothetical protein